MTKRDILRSAAALALLAMAGSAPSAAPPREHVINMANMSYGRIPSGIKVGDTILWVNRDNVPHTATARNRAFNVVLLQGRSSRMTVTRAGTFAIYCIYHPMMRSRLTVAAA